MAAVEEDLKQEFMNNSPGWLGVTVITGRHHDPKAIPIAPGDRVFLTREEQILTTRAYRDDEDSPFRNGLDAVAVPGQVKDDLYLPYDAPLQGAEEASDTAAEETPAQEITGVTPEPAGEAGIGQQAATEIPGTPTAQRAAAPPAAPRVPVAKASPSVPKSLTTP